MNSNNNVQFKQNLDKVIDLERLESAEILNAKKEK